MNKKRKKSKMGMAMLELGAAATAVEHMTVTAWEADRDFTREEAARLREHSGKMLCAALEVERVALGIPAPTQN